MSLFFDLSSDIDNNSTYSWIEPGQPIRPGRILGEFFNDEISRENKKPYNFSADKYIPSRMRSNVHPNVPLRETTFDHFDVPIDDFSDTKSECKIGPCTTLLHHRSTDPKGSQDKKGKQKTDQKGSQDKKGKQKTDQEFVERPDPRTVFPPNMDWEKYIKETDWEKLIKKIESSNDPFKAAGKFESKRPIVPETKSLPEAPADPEELKALKEKSSKIQQRLKELEQQLNELKSKNIELFNTLAKNNDVIEVTEIEMGKAKHQFDQIAKSIKRREKEIEDSKQKDPFDEFNTYAKKTMENSPMKEVVNMLCNRLSELGKVITKAGGFISVLRIFGTSAFNMLIEFGSSKEKCVDQINELKSTFDYLNSLIRPVRDTKWMPY